MSTLIKKNDEFSFRETLPASSMRGFIWELVKPYRKWLIVIFCCMLLETLSTMAAPWPLKFVLDSVVGHHPLPNWLAWLNNTHIGPKTVGLAAAAAASLVIIVTIGAIAGYIDNYFTESVGQYVANDLRLRTYNHFQRLSLRFFDTHKLGNLVSIVTTDVTTIQNFASSTLLNMLVSAMTILGMIGVMFWLNWDFASIAVVVAPVLLFLVSRFKKSIKEATREVRTHQSDIVSVLEQGLGSMRAVKAYGRQDVEVSRLREASEQAVAASLKARKVKSLLSPIIAVTSAICTAFVLWRGASLVLADAITVGALTVFLYYLARFFKPVQNLGKITTSIAQVSVALERVHAILDADAIIPQKPDGKDPGKVKGEIVFEHVDFTYDKQETVLQDINFSVQQGQKIGVCGPTGSGKSTLLSLIPRFYDPCNGRVLIDGVDITDYDLKKLREQIGFVLQDTVLFAGTIAENIAYGRIDATPEEIVAAATIANAHEFIARMPQGYNSAVGDRGFTLSGGQRQRIGIARALIRNSPILILDEPTAALDTESEKLVVEALERLMAGRTVITITHRLSTIRNADKILVIKSGTVAEQGTHDELVALGGVYSGLYTIQTGFPGHKSIRPEPEQLIEINQ
jgi:ABC-type multidrug transport system fused ATPase/permease subunit